MSADLSLFYGASLAVNQAIIDESKLFSMFKSSNISYVSYKTFISSTKNFNAKTSPYYFRLTLTNEDIYQITTR